MSGSPGNSTPPVGFGPPARRETGFEHDGRPLPGLRPGVLFCLIAACGVGSMAVAQQTRQVADIRALKQLTLDELMAIEVTSVSRRAEPYGEVAAALSVITAEDIRHSGATTVPELLRGVPGLHVAQQTSNIWAVSARGFSSLNSEKLLVLSDTRSIYTPLVSGVLWDVQDYLLADIERIEVIRGPGAAMWGSNAVNGVINITTKSARDTHGTHVELLAGTEETATVAVRHGDQTAGGIHYRVYGKYFERGETLNPADKEDDWRMGQAGFRADWSSGSEDEFTVQGSLYRGEVGRLFPAISAGNRPGPTGDLETRVAGGHILGRWRRTFSASSDLQFRAYYDRTHRDDPSYDDDLDTIDLDLQHRFTPAPHHEVVWGANYRYTSNEVLGKVIFNLRPAASEDHLFSAFVQDQIALGDSLQITLGTKAEHNDFSGFELQPSIRAAWEVNDRHMLWAAVSRAARIPTRLERDIFVDASNPAGNPVVRILGNEDFEAEKIVAYELGYRWRASDQLHLDVALFENHYDRLASLEIETPFVDPADGRTVIPVVTRNLTDGRARGVETVITYSPFDWWRLSASHSYFSMTLNSAGQDANRGEFYEGATPRHQLVVASYLSLPGGFELDAQFRHLADLKRMPQIANGTGIPGYSELDVQLTWQASRQMRVSLVGQNLLHDHHVEFGSPANRGEIERGIYAKVVWEL
jgi:iron complex outermembrane receptor protein